MGGLLRNMGFMEMYYRTGKYGEYRKKPYVTEGEHICVCPSKPPIDNLYEGVTKTYSTKNVLKKFETDSEFKKCEVKCFEWNTANTIAGHISVVVPKKYGTNPFEERLRKLLESNGYYLASVFSQEFYSDDNDEVVDNTIYQFEPRFQPNRLPKIFGDKIYHITTKNGYEKIKKYEVSPRSNCLVGYNYPERVYFFTVYNKELFKQYIKNSAKSNKQYNGSEIVDTEEYIINLIFSKTLINFVV